MRTTLNLDDYLLREAKARAAAESRTLTSVIEDALRSYLTESKRVREPYVLKWDPVRGSGRPPVDPADRGALYDWMDRHG